MQNLTDLREILGETMRGVMNGTIKVDQANAIANVAKQVNDTAKLEIDMARATGGDFLGSGFIDVDARITKRVKHDV